MKQPKTDETLSPLDLAHRRVGQYRIVLFQYHKVIWRNPAKAYDAAARFGKAHNLTLGELATYISYVPERFGKLNGRRIPLWGDTRLRALSLEIAAMYESAAFNVAEAEQIVADLKAQQQPVAA